MSNKNIDSPKLIKERRNKGTNNRTKRKISNMNKIHSKIVHLNPTIMVIPLNVNELKDFQTGFKRQEDTDNLRG